MDGLRQPKRAAAPKTALAAGAALPLPAPEGLNTLQPLVRSAPLQCRNALGNPCGPGAGRADWHGTSSDEPIHGLIVQFMAVSEGRIGGFPDVVAFWDDGRISLQEMKLSGKDALKLKQHQAADRLRKLLGAKAELSVLEWGQGRT